MEALPYESNHSRNAITIHTSAMRKSTIAFSNPLRNPAAVPAMMALLRRCGAGVEGMLDQLDDFHLCDVEPV